jgi:hypothetical protein
MMNELVQILRNTGGRFTTLIVNRHNGQQKYCARIKKTTDKLVKFEDINTGKFCRAPLREIVFARSGDTLYRKPRR